MKIVLLDSNSLGEGLDLTVFNSLGELISYGYTEKKEVPSRIKDADVIITNKVALNRKNLIHAVNLKLICVTGTGTDNIDKEYLNETGIVLSNAVNYSTESVAQHTFAMLFYLYEKLAYYDKYVKSGKYIDDDKFSHYETTFSELYGKKWGIIGLGTIGKRVAEIAEAFGCNVSFFSASGKTQSNKYEQVELNTLLSESDIVSIHAPLNKHTEGLLSYDNMSVMKSDSILLNLGRGGIINEEDLARILEEDIIGGAGLDVLSEEPMKRSCPLAGLKRNSHKLFITPHIGWASSESRQRVIQEVYYNIAAYIEGDKRNEVL